MNRRDIVNLGFVKIEDLISANSSSLCFITPPVNPEEKFFLMSTINSIPAEWHSVLKASTDESVIDALSNTHTIRMESNNVVRIS